MTKRFSSEATEEFVESIKKALQEKNVDLFYRLLPTKDELKVLKVPNVNKFYKDKRKRISESSAVLFHDLEENKIDTTNMDVVDVDVEMEEYSSLWGTKHFSITFRGGDTEFLVILKEVIILDKRLIWGGRGIDFELKNEKTVSTEEGIRKKELDAVWTGTHKVETIENLGGYLEYAHKEAVVYESLHVEGNLDLDTLCNEGINTLIIKGDLTVNGDIINENSNTGTTLSVEGTTRADNMIAGGAIISLYKVIIKDFTIGFYNDGILSIEKLCTDILISNDHHTEITDTSEIEIYIDWEEDDKGKINIEDIDALIKYLAQNKEFTETFELIEEDDGELRLDYEVLNHVIVEKKYDVLKRKIFEFVGK